MAILTTNTPFLQSQAQMMILPASNDGNMSHPVLTRTKSLLADNYEVYYKKATSGELALGDVLIHRVAKQTTGLGVQSGGAEYVANIITQKSSEKPVSVRTLTLCLTNLKPQLYDLMRYKGVQRVALLGSPLLPKTDMADSETVTWLTPERILDICHEVLGDIPRITLEIYFGKDTPLPILSDDTKNT